MSRVVDDVNEPIAISKIAGRYLLFDVTAVTYLRRKHNICGVLIGTIPQAPQQNTFQGLPVELLPEEVRLLVENEVAYIVDDAALHKEWLGTSQGADRRLYLDSLRAQGLKAQKNAEAISKMKTQRALAFQARNQPFQDPIRALDPDADDLVDSNITPNKDSGLFDAEPMPSPPQSAVSSLYSVTPTTTIMPPYVRQSYQQDLDPPVSVAYPLFAHLHAQDYFITPGLRFGCDYTVYPGDPLRFHSHFLATGYGWDEEIPLLDLVGGGRLGTGVKKGFLIGGEKSAVKSGDGVQVRSFSIEWGGM